MKTPTTLYKKQGNITLFWRINCQDNNSVSILWGYVGKSIGSRVKSFNTYESTLAFYHDLTNRIKQSFNDNPNISRYRVNIRIKNYVPAFSTSDPFVETTYQMYEAIKDVLEYNGNGSTGTMKIENDILTIPFNAIDSQMALNSIRDVLVGFGIGRNRLLFLPQ